MCEILEQQTGKSNPGTSNTKELTLSTIYIYIFFIYLYFIFTKKRGCTNLRGIQPESETWMHFVMQS